MTKIDVLGPYRERFLKEFWQKKPLLLRGAFPGGISSMDPDSLAGLACQEGIDSRIVIEHGSHPWQTFHGPFDDKFFQQLPASHWTLLVQAVDRLVPEVSALRSHFSFLPNWRLDDIMISYAVDQGSVGPHTDHYDVFLIQALGKRRWDYGTTRLESPRFVAGLDLKILEEFTADESFVLEAGDMLYLPPDFAHHGIAQGECMTYSVGFRAPTQNELLASFSQFLLQTEHPEHFYTDSTLETGTPGLIRNEELTRLRSLMLGAIADESVFRRWIGAFLTEPRSFHEGAEEHYEASTWNSFIRPHTQLVKVEGGRFAYHKWGGEIFFAVEGETLVLQAEAEAEDFVRFLCENEVYPVAKLLAFAQLSEATETLSHLWNQGFLRLPYEE